MAQLFATGLTIPGGNGTGVQVQAPPGIPTDISLGALAGGFLNIVIFIGIILSLVYLIYGGLYWVQSKGNKEQLDKARRIILFAIIGLVVMAVSMVAVNLVAAALGVQTLLTP